MEHLLVTSKSSISYNVFKKIKNGILLLPRYSSFSSAAFPADESNNSMWSKGSRGGPGALFFIGLYGLPTFRPIAISPQPLRPNVISPHFHFAPNGFHFAPNWIHFAPNGIHFAPNEYHIAPKDVISPQLIERHFAPTSFIRPIEKHGFQKLIETVVWLVIFKF